MFRVEFINIPQNFVDSRIGGEVITIKQGAPFGGHLAFRCTINGLSQTAIKGTCYFQ